MTDLLPTIPARHLYFLRSTRMPVGLPLFAFLLSVLLVGCSDSHSDEFVEFSSLEQETVLSPPENANGLPPGDDAETPALSTSADAVETVSHSTEADIETTADKVSAVDASKGTETDATDVEPNMIADPSAEESAGTEPQTITLLIPYRQFRREGNALRATFDDIDLLKILNMDPVPTDAADHFPDWLNALDGVHVRIRGYMRPGFENEDITQFLFVRDNGECCYGPIPKIYDMIAVELAEGESTDLIEGTPFDVEGTLRIEPHADDVELYGLFFIDDGVIID